MLCNPTVNLQEWWWNMVPQAQLWQHWEAFSLSPVLFLLLSFAFSITSLPVSSTHSILLIPVPILHPKTPLSCRYKYNSRELAEQSGANSSEKIRVVPFREFLQNYLTEFLEQEQQQQGKMSALIWCGFLLNADWFIKALNRWQVWQSSMCAVDRFIMPLILKYLCRNRLSEINYLVHKSILLEAAMITAISIKLCNETLLSVL